MSGYIQYGKNLDGENLLTFLNNAGMHCVVEYVRKYFDAIGPEFSEMIYWHYDAYDGPIDFLELSLNQLELAYNTMVKAFEIDLQENFKNDEASYNFLTDIWHNDIQSKILTILSIVREFCKDPFINRNLRKIIKFSDGLFLRFTTVRMVFLDEFLSSYLDVNPVIIDKVFSKYHLNVLNPIDFSILSQAEYMQAYELIELAIEDDLANNPMRGYSRQWAVDLWLTQMKPMMQRSALYRVSKLNLGSETNATILSRLKKYLDDNNAVLIKHDWGVGGSQEIEIWIFNIHNEEIKIEAETYEGITIYGSPAILGIIQSTMMETEINFKTIES